MADLVINRAEMTAMVKKFQSYGNDSMAYSRDHFEKNKREECCELQGGRLNFFESVKPEHNTTTTVVEVEKRRGTNILILRCGPGGRTVIFLEFDSKRLTDEWQEALCQYTGQTHVPNPALRRVRSELPAVMRRRRMKRTQSAFPDVVDEQVDSDAPLPTSWVTTPETSQEAPLETFQEAPLETPQEAPLEGRQGVLPGHTSFGQVNSGEASNGPDGELALSSSGTATGSESPEISDGGSTSPLSSFGSLKSNEPDYMTDKVCDYPKDLLNQHQFKDYQGEIVVTQSVPDSDLHPGDTIALETDEGTSGEETSPSEKLRAYIQKTEKQKIRLAVTRGVKITVKDGDQKLTINISGSKRPDAVEAGLKACNQGLAIAEINDAPIPVGTQEDQVAQKLREALRDSTEGHLHLIPRSLMTAESDDQETRPINVEKGSSDTNTTDNEETEC